MGCGQDNCQAVLVPVMDLGLCVPQLLERVEQALTTRLCRYSWKVSERQEHCGQAGSE